MGRPRIHNRGLPNRVVLRHNAYYYINPVDGRWERLCKANDLSAMHRALAERLERQTLFSFNDLFDLYETRVMPNKAASTRKIQGIYLKKLRSKFGARDPNSIEPPNIAEYLDGAEAKTSANREIALLSNVFTYGVRWGRVKRNPCLGVVRNTEKPRKVYVSSPRFWGAWTDAPLQLGLAMELSLTTGQRLNDLLALKKTALHDEGIHFVQRKTGVSIVIEWTEWLRDVIARCAELSGDSPYVLVTTNGTRWTDSGFQTAWQRFMRERADRFQFRDIRKKSGNDGETGTHLGNDARTFDKWYALKPKRAKALSGREILDSVLDSSS